MIVQTNPALPPIPPIKISKDDYISVEGKPTHGPAVKKESFFVKEVVYADKDSNYALATEKHDEGRLTLAALYFSNALDNMKEQKWAPEYCNYGVGNAFFAAGIFNGYKGRSRTVRARRRIISRRRSKPIRNRVSCSTSWSNCRCVTPNRTI